MCFTVEWMCLLDYRHFGKKKTPKINEVSLSYYQCYITSILQILERDLQIFALVPNGKTRTIDEKL